MAQDKIEEFKDDAKKAQESTEKNVEEKVDSLENDNSGEEETKEDIQETFEQNLNNKVTDESSEKIHQLPYFYDELRVHRPMSNIISIEQSITRNPTDTFITRIDCFC